AGETHSAEVARGIRYLIDTQHEHGTWDEALFTGTGFPRVFYLRYHYYRHYFPLMAFGLYARHTLRDFPPVPRELEKSRAIKQFIRRSRNSSPARSNSAGSYTSARTPCSCGRRCASGSPARTTPARPRRSSLNCSRRI